jgi:hypothetical protein
MKSFRRGGLAVIILALTGCAAQPPVERSDARPAVEIKTTVNPLLDELLLYSGKLAKSSSSERLAQCRELRQRHRIDPSLENSLRLMLAQTASAACGELPASDALIDGSLKGIGDERLNAFLLYHKAILSRLDREEDRRKSLEKRVSLNRTKVEKASRRLQAQESELRMLQKKLEQLKALEQSLDEPSDER